MLRAQTFLKVLHGRPELSFNFSFVKIKAITPMDSVVMRIKNYSTCKALNITPDTRVSVISSSYSLVVIMAFICHIKRKKAYNRYLPD